jgi:hypothetical protein
MTIPPAVIAALAAIPADNPLPDVTTLPISSVTLTKLETQLVCWRKVRDICKALFDVADNNIATLTTQTSALAALLNQ